ncbi:MAG: branched-chain amino acid ABC transporter permease [Solirubrobacterales bacterium]|nr:branched-chain amino acid ABC transporter permease [Solirubrobacterales bacterium]
MGDAVAFLVAGLGLGAVYGLLGLGIMTLYRATGVLNFAFGAIGVLAVYSFASLVDAGVPAGLAFVGVVVAAFPFGMLLDLLIMRRFRDEDQTTKAVATIGLLIGMIGVVGLIWGGGLRSIPQWLPDWNIEVSGAVLPSDRLIVLGVVAVVLAVLWYLFTHTRTGVALRAMAGDRGTAALVGIPIGRLTPLIWGLSASIAALALVLVAPSRGPDAATLGLLVIPGLAAAVIGNLRSPAGVVAGGLVLGVVEAETGLWAKAAENALAVPFVVLLVVLLWRQRNVLVPALEESGGRA